MLFTTAFTAAAALFGMAAAAPAGDSTADLAKRQSGTGSATYYYQYGVAGSCGTVHSDSDYICALSVDIMESSYCGETIQVNYNGKSVDVVVADTCEGCAAGDIDLSVAAFESLADLSAGRISVTWAAI